MLYVRKNAGRSLCIVLEVCARPLLRVLRELLQSRRNKGVFSARRLSIKSTELDPGCSKVGRGRSDEVRSELNKMALFTSAANNGGKIHLRAGNQPFPLVCRVLIPAAPQAVARNPEHIQISYAEGRENDVTFRTSSSSLLQRSAARASCRESSNRKHNPREPLNFPAAKTEFVVR